MANGKGGQVTRQPRVAVTVGDPAGIGPEIVLKALASSERTPAEYVVYGPIRTLDALARRMSWRTLTELGIGSVDVPLRSDVPLGQVTAEGGRVAAEAVLRAARDAMARKVDALATAPLNKESLRAAGYPFPGHTELLADVAGVKDVAMMFVGGPLRVALVTIHRSLRSVPDAITGAEVSRVVRLVDRELPRFGAQRRRIAVCGLNPHAGEGGLFGTEERDAISPAIDALKRDGVDCHGPFPADTLFGRAFQGEFDAVVALYHDQGLIPVKLMAFGKSVNVTLGLPFPRASVDHGTAFDIAGKGIAAEGSMLAAMKVAVQLALAP
jgi:4-hydroxythreonine-4-phosphate dehydrogenase